MDEIYFGGRGHVAECQAGGVVAESQAVVQEFDARRVVFGLDINCVGAFAETRIESFDCGTTFEYNYFACSC